ncbi:MAG: hypothetical protein SAK29_21880 [Scytonema sp. PMC 1069.18]|nr:hypothetical protein [Scytonema sp. PMC 1069.18]MEC4883665.1 hypothetical protein [Scytonema sp. PMC 1070.18]
MYTEEFELPENSLQETYTKTQLQMLDDLESYHNSKPEKEALVISVGLSIIEAVVAYSMLASTGIFIAAIVASFPVALLWAIANYHAEKVELPEVYDKLVEEYYDNLQ